MLIIHILVDTSQIPTQVENVVDELDNTFKIKQQIQLHLLLQVQNSSNIYQNI